ncbi:type I methionyl aminopeptidase [Candidatus Peregrinibacteria bacterium RIFCSPLOWO2_01_FULL_39_12]|nr:MAG: type I methionyl aminopeptidase [Candidatus Peregrinibacteria bacterium RIFCSPLOWO2_01_FULL_39_12]OGJ43417.1 MAG: type I methionyl aminopeptidase [Candidatus Peregrinibacteria bacterium RIFCSPLOWO2_02_FULL_39_10]
MPIQIKTEEEIRSMKISGKILAEALEKTCKFAKPGMSTLELDSFAENLIRKRNAIPAFKGYRGFPATLCTCINEVIVHGIPKKDKIMQEGDLLTIDCGVIYEGMYADAARSIIIGKSSSSERKRLIKTAHEALNKVTDILKPGLHLNEIGKTIQKIVGNAGFHIVKDLTGHGIGHRLHEEPIILNYWDGTPGPILKPGMTLAIEPIFAVGTGKMRLSPDKWTLTTTDYSDAVQVENTFLITENGNEVLTEL